MIEYIAIGPDGRFIYVLGIQETAEPTAELRHGFLYTPSTLQRPLLRW